MHILCVSASVPLIVKKRCCLQVSLTLRICVYCRMPFYIAPPFPAMPTFTSVNLAAACFSFSVELAAGWAFVIIIDQVLTAIDFVEYCLLLCSCTTHTKLLTCYGYMIATRILHRSHSVLCCRTPVTSSSHRCLYASCSSSVRYSIHFSFIN